MSLLIPFAVGGAAVLLIGLAVLLLIPPRVRERKPVPLADVGQIFQLEIERAFALPHRSALVTGTVEGGSLSVGESVWVVEPAGRASETVCLGIKMEREHVDFASRGDRVGVLLESTGDATIPAVTRLLGKPPA